MGCSKRHFGTAFSYCIATVIVDFVGKLIYLKIADIIRVAVDIFGKSLIYFEL